MIAKKVMILMITILLWMGTGHSINVYADAQQESEQTEPLKLPDQIQRVKQAIQDNQEIIVDTKKEMETVHSQMKKLEDEIVALEEKINKRNEVLKDRMQNYQESGGTISYLDVLLGSSDFRDLVSRTDLVSKILLADQHLIELQVKEKKSLDHKQDVLKNKQAELTEQNTEYEGMLAQAMEQKEHYESLQNQLTSKKEEVNTIDINYPQIIVNQYINKIITSGYKYIGNSVYVFGGGRTESDIANGRFDCSAFVHWAFSQAGIDVGLTTDTLKHSGLQVSAEELRPGDLVFFDTYKKDGHVGIYIGNSQFIGSQSSTGVAIANMDEGYWKETFNGRIVRLVN